MERDSVPRNIANSTLTNSKQGFLMFRSSLSLRKAPHSIKAVLLSATLLSGCAAIPDLGPAKETKAVELYASAKSFEAPSSNWPSDRWWTQYGDAQLNALIDEAIEGSPDLTQAQARLRQAEGLAQRAGAARLPQVSADASITGFKLSENVLPSSIAPEGWNDFGQASLNFSYEFDFWGKNRAAFAAATSDTQAVQAEFAASRLMLAAAVASAYADLAQLYADRDAAVDAVRVRSETFVLLSQRLAQGLENEGAVRQAGAGQASAEAQLATVEESIGLTKNRIAALTGAGPDRGLAIVRPAMAMVRPFGLPANLQVDLIGRRPDIVAARLRTESAAQRIDVAKAEFYPNINLSAMIGLQALGIGNIANAGSNFGSIGPALSLPIFSGGRLEGNYRASHAEYDASIAAYDGALTQALKDVADVATSSRALGLRLAKSRDAVTSSGQAYAIAQNRYRGGLSNYLDVLAAEDSLIANRRAVADLETRAFALDIALARALGGGFQP